MISDISYYTFANGSLQSLNVKYSDVENIMEL